MEHRPCWIPEDKRELGAAWVDLDEEAPACYVNIEHSSGVTCNNCGSTNIMITEVVESLKTRISDFCDQHGIEDLSYMMGGDRTGDLVCTCIDCGDCEAGSPPFGMLMEVPK